MKRVTLSFDCTPEEAELIRLAGGDDPEAFMRLRCLGWDVPSATDPPPPLVYPEEERAVTRTATPHHPGSTPFDRRTRELAQDLPRDIAARIAAAELS